MRAIWQQGRGRGPRAPLLLASMVLVLGACPSALPAALPRPTALGAPEAADPPEPTLTLALGGDVMLGRLVDRAVRRWGPRHVWGDVGSWLRRADLTLVNLECAIATSGEKFQPPRVFYFRAAPEAIEALQVAGIDFVSLANNHALDYGPSALLETIRRLDEAKIAHAGAGRDLAEAGRFALLEAKGIKVGVVSFADHFRLYAATETRPGTNVIEIRPSGPDFERVREALGRVRAAGAQLSVFSIHWGPNMRQAPDPGFVEFAHAVIDAGADIFHGHSAHVFQGIEIYRGKPILYDTGDLLDDYRVDPQLRNDQQLHERMRQLSAAMGTAVERHGNRLRVRPGSPRP